MEKFIKWVLIGIIALTVLCVVVAVLLPTPEPKVIEPTEVVSLVPKSTLVSTGTVIHKATVIKSMPTITNIPLPKVSVSQKQASLMAKEYLDYSAFSRSGLIKQLEYEGFSKEDATYGVDTSNVDWMEQASLMAKEYLEYSAFSRSGLISQLQYEGFTIEQATYGVDSVGL